MRFRLEAQGTAFSRQEQRFPRISNLIVDFSSSPRDKYLLFSAHQDAVNSSPGANDNASSIAVLIELCRRLKGRDLPVRVVFFDREEAWFRTPLLRLGLLGSFSYVLGNDVKRVLAAFNLEFCGLGDSLAIWPVKPREIPLPAVRCAQRSASLLNVPSRSGHLPWVFLSSDHLPFRLAGVRNSVTLSLLPAEQLPVLEAFVRSLSVPKLLSGHRPPLPGVLGRIHKSVDDSSTLSEDSLELMVSLLVQIIELYPCSPDSR